MAPDGTPRFAASHLGLFCLPMSHKKDARLLWVNQNMYYMHVQTVYTFFYNTSCAYCREMAPGTVSLTGDWFRGDDSKQNSNYTKTCGCDYCHTYSLVYT